MAASVVLPSGKIYQFNIKLTLAALLALCAIAVWRELLADPLGRRHLAVLAYIGVVVAAWSIVATANGFNPLPEVRSILGPFTLIAAYHARLVPKRWLLDVYCASAIVYAALKLALLLGRFLGVVDESDPVLVGFSVFDIHLATGRTCPGAPDRLTLPNDLALALFPLLLLHGRYRRRWMYGAVVLCGLAVLASFSRYLTVAFVAVCMLAAWQLVSFWPRMATLGAMLVTLALAHVLGGAHCFVQRMVPWAGPVAEAEVPVGARPSDGRSINRLTDGVRKEQFDRLSALWAKKPLVGHGVGAYDPGYLRSEQLPYAYELQLLSFGAKFGAIGLALLALGAAALCLLHFGRGAASWLVVAVLAASGLTNPFYESTGIGVAFVLTVVTFSRWFRK